MPSLRPRRPGTTAVAPGVVALTGLSSLPPTEAEAVSAVGALVQQAFAAGHHRVEAEVDADDAGTRRVLQRAGLRPEGRARGRGLDGSGRVDLLRLARLVEDPEPGTPAAFLGMLDATLPLKRVIVQGLIHDRDGRVLLCELTYKKDWDLVGGVAEPAESPVDSLLREVREELGVDLPVGELLAVDWLPPYRQWRDALLLVFDLGVHPDLAQRVVLQPSELTAVRWCTVEEAEGRVAPYVHRLLVSLRGALRDGGGTVFLEDGVPLPTARSL
ncbi:NUDIX hydrolase [Ornithinimicrobium cerasi]|uniref:ADP-ribose pyrophosphatase YjhB, NUDIX family n=1 Tax=Ornithinimicrobium cerasi TaxID=2248773 RepID=A0A285VTG2_9MICO|nr:NUDIX hydrolase [Ornithinimicrobium cerasi]SOC57360.1 ADP-ribose pyrophosphatase YjhB, NUDIX family [Ornithinimicrobium cerasi]